MWYHGETEIFVGVEARLDENAIAAWVIGDAKDWIFTPESVTFRDAARHVAETVSGAEAIDIQYAGKAGDGAPKYRIVLEPKTEEVTV